MVLYKRIIGNSLVDFVLKEREREWERELVSGKTSRGKYSAS